MAAGIPRPSSDENISTTLSSGITDVATSIDVADASKIVAPCYLVIDRVDSAGTAKATSLWEYVKVTNVASNTLTVTRGQGGSTGQAHGSGAVIEAVVTSSMFEDWYNCLNPEHTATGGHVISTATITKVEGVQAAFSSVASITYGSITSADIRSLAVPSIASVATMFITTHIQASGASIVGWSTGSANTSVPSGVGTGATFNITEANGTYADAGCGVGLPGAGTYLVTAMARGQCVASSGNNGAIAFKLRDITNSADVANSITLCTLADLTSRQAGTGSCAVLHTAAGAATISIWATSLNATFSERQLNNDDGSVTHIQYIKLV